MAKRTLKFKTELTQLLHLITHSLYSHREVFLRELISNACDAIDKVRFEGLTNSELLDGDTDWKITIKPNKETKTLTISDNGIGMSQESIVKNLGTIAHSGTKAFLDRAQDMNLEDNPELIGQFGVGFYSAFMVADKVTVISKAHGEEAVQWESNGSGSFTVSETDRQNRGTDVILHLKDDATEYLNEWKIRSIVKKFSDFVEHPIILLSTEKDDKSGTENAKEEQLNTQKAIWLRSKEEITDEEYTEFYKHISHDDRPPAEIIHYHAEGAIEFKALLYIPEHKPFDMMWNNDPRSHLNLYVQRVFIGNDFENLLPGYLRFVKGVVDSSDLPLNVSREILQENPLLDKIRKNLVSRILKTLEKMKEKDFEKFKTFHENFGSILKEGIHTDWSNREKIADLLLFETTARESGNKTTLHDYVENMTEGQEEIFYLVGESRTALENSPYVESYKAEGKEVLLMTDPIDEFVMPHLGEYKGKKFKAVNKGEIDDDKETLAKEKKTFKDFIDYAQKLLDDVKEVRLTTRLKDSAACLVGDEYSMSPHIEELMRRMGQEVPKRKSVLELNPKHPLVKKVQELYQANKKDPKVETYTRLLYDQAVIASGAKPEDPVGVVARINELLVN